MIYNSGAGPKPIPHKELTTEKLRNAITFAVSPAAKKAAAILSQKIHDEVIFTHHLRFTFKSEEYLQNGVSRGVESFYKHLPLLNMRCDLDPSQLAVWWSTEQVLLLIYRLLYYDERSYLCLLSYSMMIVLKAERFRCPDTRGRDIDITAIFGFASWAPPSLSTNDPYLQKSMQVLENMERTKRLLKPLQEVPTPSSGILRIKQGLAKFSSEYFSI